MITVTISRKTGELINVEGSEHPDDKPIEALLDALAECCAASIIADTRAPDKTA